MKAKKILAIAAAALLTMTAFTACGNSETASTSSESSASESSVSESSASESSEESSETVSQLGGSVSTDGSTSMEKLMGIYQEVYTELSGTTINYNPTGSGSGITAVTEGRCDIGLASRNLKDEEAAAGLTGHIVAIDGIAIVVNPESKVADLTVEQIKQLYTGEITDWSKVGGDAGEVVVIGRESGSGTRDGFESVVGLLTPSKKRCPHLGCALKYNKAEHSWDCSCHGSRFSESGRVLDNPANGNLKK